ncbi:protein of unknown function [Taphrina deformans PYCC 5710]|uniref:Tubulin-specific chaperone A n=1 Tax=Taphrina deformans (strain PYCC 5710 / ATCC 11124 / CBS 356.35 / IMI 108563 / JCM 9778 / NBRC 8474) TaxID=1097556 RepID=R4XEV7_TAPDE|nr:protein of unknown function [Taphrina deformans PYCC 5710]|eukprot:CCG84397.1 protein of unknown function [Taphrina deformans PYCC 5710]
MSEAKRSLKIKTGAVKRLAKDVQYSQKESESERTRLATLKANGGDEYEIRAQDKVIADADQMIPDYRKRLAAAIEELEELTTSDEPALQDSEELKSANEVLAEARKQL